MNITKDETNRELGLKAHTCRICRKRGDYPAYLVREMMQNKREEFEYFQCTNCNCLQIADIPDDLGEYYGSNYYSFTLKESDVEAIDFPEVKYDLQVLDVGCGSGIFLVEMAHSGYSPVYGCDAFIEKDINYKDKVFIKKCTIHEMDGSYDLIRLEDSFEHMTDPHEVLDSVHRLLKPEGECTISIPVYPNAAFEMLGPHWYQMDAPRHIFLHSVESMEYLTSRHGLEIANIKYNSNNTQFIRSMLYQFGIPFKEQTDEIVRAFFSQEQIASMSEKAAFFNLKKYGDHATFTLQHKNK